MENRKSAWFVFLHHSSLRPSTKVILRFNTNNLIEWPVILKWENIRLVSSPSTPLKPPSRPYNPLSRGLKPSQGVTL